MIIVPVPKRAETSKDSDVNRLSLTKISAINYLHYELDNIKLITQNNYLNKHNNFYF